MRRRGILGGGRAKITWVQRDLFHGLTWFRDAVNSGVQHVVEDVAKEAEAYMKANAPWEDRTTLARSTLSATAYHNKTVSGILLAHGVDYGRWLELRFGGRFAIVIPTMDVMGDRLMVALGQHAFNEADRALNTIGAGDAFL